MKLNKKIYLIEFIKFLLLNKNLKKVIYNFDIKFTFNKYYFLILLFKIIYIFLLLNRFIIILFFIIII